MVIPAQRLLEELRSSRSELLRLPGVGRGDIDRLTTLIGRRPTTREVLELVEHPGEALPLLHLAHRLVLARPPVPYEGDMTVKGRRVILGDLEVEGHLINEGTLLITGNLSISGNYLESRTGATLLGVGGTLRVQNVLTSCDVVVAGHVSAAELIYGVGKEHALMVAGELRALGLVLDDHTATYESLVVSQCFPHGLSATDVDELIAPQALDESGHVDLDRMWEALRRGERILEEADVSGLRPRLSPRLARIGVQIREARSHSFIEVEHRPAVRIERRDGTHETSTLTPEERAVLVAWLGHP